jgi:hypothetical protein
MTLCILLNTVALALDHHPMDRRFGASLEGINFAMTLAFLLEMVRAGRRGGGGLLILS